MGKLRFICLALCICIGLIACTATDSGNLFDAGAKEDGFVPGQLSPDESYQYGNMQKMPAGEFSRLGNDVLFTLISDGGNRLYSYDLTTGKVRLYCDDATCKHSSCVAGSILWGLEVYQGKLYGINKSRQVVAVEGMELQPITKGQIADYLHSNNKTYITTLDGALVELKEGNDELRIILEEYTGNRGTVFNDYLYATTSDSIIRVDLTADSAIEELLVSNASGITDGLHIYYADRKTYYLYRCDMDGNNAELLLEQPVLPASWNFDDEYFYYRLYTDHKLNKGEDCYDLYRFTKSDPSKIEKFATLPVPAYQVYTVPGTDALFVTAYMRSDGENNDIYVVNRDGGQITRLEIPEY